MWNTYDDLDLHVLSPSGANVYHGNKKVGGGELDVDMNAGGQKSNKPVENVYFGQRGDSAPHGSYTVTVRNYAYHTDPPHGQVQWKVRVKVHGETLREETG